MFIDGTLQAVCLHELTQFRRCSYVSATTCLTGAIGCMAMSNRFLSTCTKHIYTQRNSTYFNFLPPLLRFVLFASKYLEDHDALHLATFSAFKGCRLKRVNLRRCNNVDDVWLASMTCSSLRCLDLASCTQVTDTGLSQVMFYVNEAPEVMLKLFLTSNSCTTNVKFLQALRQC